MNITIANKKIANTNLAQWGALYLYLQLLLLSAIKISWPTGEVIKRYQYSLL